MTEKRDRIANTVGSSAVLLILLTVLLGLIWSVDWRIVTSVGVLLLGVAVATAIVAEAGRR